MPIDKGLDRLEILKAEKTEIRDEELVLGFTIGEKELAIPIKYLSGFEVANLTVDSNKYLLTWCPLVGSARIFEGEINGDLSGFDFGRGLRNNNLLIVDRKTNSVWNQLSCRAIEGELKGARLRTLPSIQSTWAFWNSKYPDSEAIINRDTSNAVFPQFVLQEHQYSTWIPGEDYPRNQGHDLKRLGLGLELNNSAAFFALEELFKKESPVKYNLDGEEVLIYFDKDGLTAWVEDGAGKMLSSTLVYDWAWKNFFPETKNIEGAP